MSNLANKFVIGPDNVQIGAVLFSSEAKAEFYLNEYSSSSAVENALLDLEYLNGATNLAGGLEVTYEQIFQVSNGDRSTVRNLAVVITDGIPTVREGDTIPEAVALKDTGARVVGIGVTLNVDYDQLREVASSSGDVYQLSDFTALDGVLEDIAGIACSEGASSVTQTGWLLFFSFTLNMAFPYL